MPTAEEQRAKLSLEDADRNRKITALKNLDTGPLIKLLQQQQDTLESALREEAKVKDLNMGFMASGNNDCAEVKRILAELAYQAPSIGPGSISPIGKKPTVAERETWLTLQRQRNHELVVAIEQQRVTMFTLESLRIDSEMAKKKMENIRAVLSLRTAQIEFLTTR